MMRSIVVRAALAAAALVPLVPTAGAAGTACRLSRRDCAILYRAMSEEASAAADDERRFRPNGLSPDERGAALVRRHLDRIDERSFTMPDRIADEWMRIEACGQSGCR